MGSDRLRKRGRRACRRGRGEFGEDGAQGFRNGGEFLG